MTDTPTPVSTKDAVINIAKIASILTLLPGVMTYLPLSVDAYLFGGMVICSAIVASVPAPAHNKALIRAYKIVQVGAIAVKYALPYMAAHLAKGADNESDKQ